MPEGEFNKSSGDVMMKMMQRLLDEQGMTSVPMEHLDNFTFQNQMAQTGRSGMDDRGYWNESFVQGAEDGMIDVRNQLLEQGKLQSTSQYPDIPNSVRIPPYDPSKPMTEMMDLRERREPMQLQPNALGPVGKHYKSNEQITKDGQGHDEYGNENQPSHLDREDDLDQLSSASTWNGVNSPGIDIFRDNQPEKSQGLKDALDVFDDDPYTSKKNQVMGDMKEAISKGANLDILNDMFPSGEGGGFDDDDFFSMVNELGYFIEDGQLIPFDKKPPNAPTRDSDPAHRQNEQQSIRASEEAQEAKRQKFEQFKHLLGR